MLVESEEAMAHLALCMDDILGIWPEMSRLPRVSSSWKVDENARSGMEKYVCVFGNYQLAVYKDKNTNEIQVATEYRTVE